MAEKEEVSTGQLFRIERALKKKLVVEAESADCDVEKVIKLIEALSKLDQYLNYQM